MIPVVGSDGWYLVSLPPTKLRPRRLAKAKVRDGYIVHAFLDEDYSFPGLFGAEHHVRRRLHWAEGRETWVEVG